MIILKEILYGSAMYESTKCFREEVLRRPLGLKLTVWDTKDEDTQIHIAAIEDDNLILGTVLLKPVSCSHIKLRQMAVSPLMQGKGIGRKLVQFAEMLARSKEFQVIEMHARINAQGFYQKLGYHAEGKVFTEVTVPTIRMTKTL